MVKAVEKKLNDWLTITVCVSDQKKRWRRLEVLHKEKRMVVLLSSSSTDSSNCPAVKNGTFFVFLFYYVFLSANLAYTVLFAFASKLSEAPVERLLHRRGSNPVSDLLAESKLHPTGAPSSIKNKCHESSSAAVWTRSALMWRKPPKLLLFLSWRFTFK